jgi:hypothetical protein
MPMEPLRQTTLTNSTSNMDTTKYLVVHDMDGDAVLIQKDAVITVFLCSKGEQETERAINKDSEYLTYIKYGPKDSHYRLVLEPVMAVRAMLEGTHTAPLVEKILVPEQNLQVSNESDQYKYHK